MAYSKDEQLILTNKVYLTKEAYDLLRVEKKKQEMSLAKIVSNLIIEKYGII